jgi:uncharacterized membrane protein
MDRESNLLERQPGGGRVVRTAKIVGCAVAGWVSFGIGDVFAGGLMYPTSNMAGIVGFITAPVGLLLGVIVGIAWAKSENK